MAKSSPDAAFAKGFFKVRCSLSAYACVITISIVTNAVPSRLIVQKYGGTSVGTPERILKVAEKVAQARALGHELVVVVSAMGHTTDELIDLAHRVSKSPPDREMDMLLTVGERISMALLSMALSDLGVQAVSLTGSQSGIVTDTSHRAARIKRISGDRVRSALADGKVVIVAGFQGVSETKEITTLGRGGSDTTAVALAATLKAKLCQIYTDVDGVFSADPRIVPQARLIRSISADVMVELATRGAGVLHPRSVELAKQYGVRLQVLNSMQDSVECTEVIAVEQKAREGKQMEEMRIVAVTSDVARRWVRIQLARTRALTSVWQKAAELNLSVVASQFVGTELAFFAEQTSMTLWKKTLTELKNQGFITQFEWKEEIVPVSVVGDRFSQDGTAWQKISEILATEHIEIHGGSASSLAVSIGVPQTQVHDAVRALHAGLGLGENH